jgi:methylenetetrahydrofolate reductase (NADPH)
MKDRKQLYEILERLRMEADVRDVLLLGGDAPKPVGEFSSSMDLLDTGYFQEFGFRSLGVAGHPEGNPDIPEDEIKRALLWKNEYARSHNVHMYIVTQFTFDPHSVYDWLEKLDQWGNELPVNVGLPGPAKLETLLKYSKLCGVRCSFNFLRKQGLKLLKLASISMPDHIISELARYYADHPHGPVTRLHFFNFGGVPLTMKFLHEIERGEFDVKWIGSGFNLHHKLH